MDDSAGNLKRSAGGGTEPDSSRSAPTPGQPTNPSLVAVTIQVQTGRIVKIENADGTGTRRELTSEQKAELKKQTETETLEQLLEQAFEAGIACVLDGPAGQKEAPEAKQAPESEEEAELRRLLLRRLIKHSAAQRLMQPQALDRAIVATMIQHAVEPAA